MFRKSYCLDTDIYEHKICSKIEGLKTPNRKHDDTWVDYEPNSGAALRNYLPQQLNFPVGPFGKRAFANVMDDVRQNSLN